MFQGVYTAIVTPFKDDKIDYVSYYKILDIQVEAGIAGVVPCGTTGESPTLTHVEHAELIRKTVEYVGKKIQVIAGTGSNSTREAIELTEHACKDGVYGILSVNPYYNKPTQEGLFLHFKEVAEHSSVPIMLYNIPGRTGVNLIPDTVKRLSELDKIAGIKEASGDLGQMAKIISLVSGKMDVLSGDDNLTLPLLALGGKGVVSVVSNFFPKSVVSLVNYFMEGNLEKSREIFFQLLPVFTLSFVETNPIPAKAVMHWLGYCKNELRLPLTPLSSGYSADELKKHIFHLRDKGFE